MKIIDRCDTQVLLSLLRLKKDAMPISIEFFAGLTGIDNMERINNIINNLVTEGIITRGNLQQILLTTRARLQLAFLLIKAGFEIEHVTKYLDWQEFEAFTKDILHHHEFRVRSRVRFVHNKKRYECDLVAICNSIVLCIDCKHWSSRPGKKYALKKAVEQQAKRTLVFSKEVERLDAKIYKRKNLRILPLLVSWLVEDVTIVHNIPIVPIFQLDNFLNQIDVIIDNFKIISINK